MEKKVNAVKQKILGAATVIGAFTFLAQIGGFGKELTVAAWFGIGDALDAFLMAFLIPNFVVNVIGGSLSAAFLPTFIQAYKNQDTAIAHNILSNVIGWFVLPGIFLSFLILILAPQFLSVLCSGFSVQKFFLTRIIHYFLILIFLLSVRDF